MDQNTQAKLFHAASYASVVSTALMGLKEKTHTGEPINELEIAGMRSMLRKLIEIMEELTA